MSSNPTKPREALEVYDIWLNSYLNGDVKTYDQYLDDEYRFIGSTGNEEFLSRTETTEFFKATADQLAGKTEVRNSTRTIQQMGDLFFITQLLDFWFLNEKEWFFYGRFRLTSVMRKRENEWKFVYQHFSMPDSKADAGDTIGWDQVNKENIELREAVKRRTIELENKNRELAIEAALEKVRAIALGMLKPEDMLSVCREISTQLQQFGVDRIRNVQTAIIDAEIGQYLCYQYFAPYDREVIERTEYLKSPLEHELVKQMMASQDAYFINSLTGNELDTYAAHRKAENYLPDPLLDEATEVHYCYLSIGEGGLGLTLYKAFDEEILNLFKRFHQVFSLAYQRFRDIQKAEAQAREAQIEASLERVRSRSMAMQKTEELTDAGALLYQELSKLGIQNLSTGYTLFDETATMGWSYGVNPTDGSIRNKPVGMDHTKTKVMKAIAASWKKQEPLLILQLNEQETIKHQTFIADKSIDFPISKEQLLAISPKLLVVHTFNFKQGYLLIVGGELLTEAQQHMISRFAKVFQQTYTRFLDLQKAEDQAREAEVQLALERVRARSLAMHRTSELQEVVDITAKQLHGIGMDINGGVFICINAEVDQELCLWASGGMADYAQKVVVPVLDKPIFTQIRDAIKEGNGFLIENFSDEEKREMFTHLFQYEPWKGLSKERKEELMSRRGGFARSVVISNYTSISITNHHGKGYTEKENEILNRFGKVFEQSYIRFLDLQKAEAQAREAQIEAALEKVRSRSLAMQKSDELLAVIIELSNQLQQLNVRFDFVSFGVIGPEKEIDFWMAGEGYTQPELYHMPYFDHFVTNSLLEDQKKGLRFSESTFNQEDTREWMAVLYENNPHSKMLADTQDHTLTGPGMVRASVILKNICVFMGNFRLKPHSKEQNALLVRFANAFEQAYTRFLDLQKAEAQAREAQIEAALERTRTQSMLMQHSDEITKISEVFHQQLLTLNIPSEFSYVWLPDESQNNHQFWASWSEEGKDGLSFTSKQVTYPLDKTEPYTAACYLAWSKPYRVHQEFIPPSDISDFFGTWAELLEGAERLEANNFKEGIYYSEAYMHYGCFGINIRRELSDEEKRVLKRFSTEFERAYTRFLDLQKAEAQAREAQIETALERIRSRTMAMQHSDELQEASYLLDQQVRALGIQTWGCAFNIYGEEDSTEWFGNEAGVLHTYTVPRKGIFKEYYEKGQRGESIIIKEFSGKACVDHYEYMSKLPVLGDVLKILKETNDGFPTYQIDHVVYFKYGYLLFITREDVPEAHDIFKRFANVFEQTYTRFLDLQKAEAQTREAKIETALEKVRSRTMGMQSSEELPEVANLMFIEIQSLGIPAWSCGYCIELEDGKSGNCIMSSEGALQKPFVLPYHGEASFDEWNDFVHSERTFFTQELSGKAIESHYDFMKSLPQLEPVFQELVDAGLSLPTHQINHLCKFKHGFLLFITYEQVEGSHEVFKRFTKVFDQTYTRFLDLQKAETQAREAKIETALEKVRSRTMGMQKSDELADVANVLFEEMNGLVHNLWTCGFVLCEKDRDEDEWWLSLEDGFSRGFFLPNVNDYAHAHLYEGWLKKDEFRTVQLEGDDLQMHYDWLMEVPVAKNIFDEMEAAGMQRPEWQKLHAAYFSKGYLVIITREPCPEEDIFKRFAQVFDLTYTRFLDLKKAEAQAREAQIENALEKVRSRSLAMQSPDELIEVAELLREEMGTLGVEELETSSIFILDDGSGKAQCWFTTKDADNPVKSVSDQVTINLKDTWVGRQMNEFYGSGQDTTSILTKGDQRIEWFRYIEQHSDLLGKTEFFEGTIPERTVHLCKFPHGFLGAASPGNISDDSWDLIKRATRVFSFAYTRFLDLQKAEMQAREAQLELSLERIRARVTGMQESSDLLDIVVTMRSEFVNLGHEAHYFWHMRWLPNTYKKAMTSGDGTKIGMVMTLPRHIHGDIEEVAAWEKTKDPIHVLAMDVDVAVDYVDKMITLGDFERVDPQAPTLDDIRHIGGLTFVMARTTHGEIGFSLPGVVPDPPKDAVDTLVRFAGVFDLAYRRFEDLKKAEAQARENQIELALEKVRSRTMTMERSSELADTSVVVFKELLNLGIAPNRLFIGIIKDNGNAVEAWATNEDGSKIENQFQLYPSENKSIQKMVNAWKQEKKTTIIDMSGKELKDYFHYLNTVMHIPFIDGLQQKRRVQTIAYFSGGLIGMAAPEEQPQETIELLERFAAVFNLTYTRFNDLKIAEKQALQAEKDLIEIKQARQKAEDALIELKATQTQLVQQEKLASLGQLTAGIAHEIKNPLNFVNNFSEVSVELIDEALEEIEKLEHSDVKEEIVEILNDVKGNLVKVHTHGTRADSIVKSMLQHSRGGSGKMESTDLNALIKEYVNLSFHGMRASKNPINAEIDLQLDPEIKTIPLIGEDFSRVILNLCNNAFDAMRETESQRPPKITVRTHKTDKHISIEIEDNGSGMPDDIKDKVLQPFFTTKKGTDGTGLGLSITNDIVKAHGGEMGIISSQGKGTIFSIHLAIKER